MTVVGSDCITGKEQLTREGARERKAMWRARGDRTIDVFRCVSCGALHVGHAPADKRRQQKQRGRR